MQRRFKWLSVVPVLAIIASGCAEKTLPEPAYPGASRDMMENPLGVAAKLKGAEQAKAKLSAKTAAARENAAKADPRGH